MNDTLEIIDLETMLNDELRCEAEHGPEEDGCSPECTVKVVARKTVTCVADSFFICQASHDYNMYWMYEYPGACEMCDRDCSECWKVVPI